MVLCETFWSFVKLGRNPDLVSFFMETWSIFGPSFTKLKYGRFLEITWSKLRPSFQYLGYDYKSQSKKTWKITLSIYWPSFQIWSWVSECLVWNILWKQLGQNIDRVFILNFAGMPPCAIRNYRVIWKYHATISLTCLQILLYRNYK